MYFRFFLSPAASYTLAVLLIPMMLGCRPTALPRAQSSVSARLTPPIPLTSVNPPATTSEFAIPVLMYHRVDNLTGRERKAELMRDLTVSPADFEEQVRYLADNDFTFLFASEVEHAVREGLSLPEKAVAITMDDGYADNFQQAFPILKQYGAKATLFLVTSTVDTPAHVSWDQCVEMRPAGMGFGSHTVTHPELPSLTDDALRTELRESKVMLERRLAMPITGVAYPSGKYDHRVITAAKYAGYLAGWKKGGGPVQPHAEPYLLPRVRVNGGGTMADFKRKVWSGLSIIRDRQDERSRQEEKRTAAS